MKEALKTVTRIVATLSLLGFASWAVAVVAYAFALRLLFGEVASSGDMDAVLFWSAPIYGISLLFVVWPVLLRLTIDFSDSRRLVVFPAAGVVCGLVPMIGLAAVWGGQHLFSPEALLFGVLFCGANAAFGFGYALLLPWVHP